MSNRDTVQDDVRRMPSAAAISTIPATSRPAEERRVIAWVGKSILFRGDLIGLEDMTIDGRVEGTIELRDHSLTVGPDAHIHAEIVAKVVTVHGSVAGTITASEAVYIHETGSVEGNITSARLAMAEGATVKGQVDTGRRDTPEIPPVSQAKATAQKPTA